MMHLATLGLLFAQADGAPVGQQILQYAPLIVMGVLFYMLMIQPERKKRAETQKMLNNLQKNNRVVTIGGIHGTVINVQKDSDEVTIRVDETTNTKLRVSRSAIARVVSAKDADSGETNKL
jgi:preprotein translocase subunit YajC